MKVAIVYHSHTGITKKAAEDMAAKFEAKGHSCSVASVKDANPSATEDADLICLGCWTAGLFILFQHPKKEFLAFAEKLQNLHAKPVILFCTYKLAVGPMLDKMAKPLLAKGAEITDKLKFRGPKADASFDALLEDLN